MNCFLLKVESCILEVLFQTTIVSLSVTQGPTQLVMFPDISPITLCPCLVYTSLNCNVRCKIQGLIEEYFKPK